jgi:putative lipoic acid-binding regulatory protein
MDRWREMDKKVSHQSRFVHLSSKVCESVSEAWVHACRGKSRTLSNALCLSPPSQQMNKYPGARTFTAIGTGGQEFKAAMVQAVEAVIGPISEEEVVERPSSGGAYVSVKMTVTVSSPDQVVQCFANMKADPRLKWFM